MKKKIFTLSAILIIVICSLFFCISASAEVYSGKCGENVTFTLDSETGLLAISGTGEMTNYQYSSKVPWDSYKSYVKTVKISDGVTSIGDYAFSFSKSLTSVTIPNSVTSIGNSAFADSSSLANVTIPDSVMSIGCSAFSFCSSFVGVTIPDSVMSIGCSAFSFCSSFVGVTIPDSVTSIGENAFAGCSSLTAIEVDENNEYYCDIDGVLFTKDKKTLVAYPGGGSTICTVSDSVTSIVSYAFLYCSSLTAIEVDENNEYYCDIDGVLFTKDRKTLVAYPCGGAAIYTIPDIVIIIGDHAFESCGRLMRVTIPDSITNIGNDAFYECRSLTSVTIPDSVTSIGYAAFHSCISLTSVTIPDSVTSIGYAAFSGCRNLASITIPDSVTSIGDHMFSYCSNLTSVTIPDSVTSIGKSSFNYCDKLETIYLYKNSTADEYFSDEEYTKIYLDDIKFGDVSGDDVINAKDIMLLAKSFAGWDVEIDKTAADCNHDEVFDIRDLVLLAQYLAGWNVTLG